MVRNILAIIAGYATMVVGAIFLTLFMSAVFPSYGLNSNRIYLRDENLLWYAAVFVTSALVSGFVTARLAKSAKIKSAFLLALIVVVPLIQIAGPSEFLTATYKFFVYPSAYSFGYGGNLLDEPPFFSIILMIFPAMMLGGYLGEMHAIYREGSSDRRRTSRFIIYSLDVRLNFTNKVKFGIPINHGGYQSA